MNAQNRKILIEIVTPYQHFFEGRVDYVVLSSLDGDFGIHGGHEPMVLALAPGLAHFSIDSKIRYAVLMEGYAEISPYVVLIVCNAAEWPEDIDVQRAQNAYNRALNRYRSVDISVQEKQYARHSLRRAKMRLKLVAEYGSEKQKNLLSDYHSI